MKIKNALLAKLACLILLTSLSLIRGMEWTEPIRLTSEPEYSGYPDIAVFNGTVNVVWHNKKGLDYEIFYRKSIDGGFNWLPEVRLTNSKGDSRFPKIAIDENGIIYVVWQENRDWAISRNYEIYFKRSTDGGNTWSAERNLSVNNSRSMHPDIMTNKGVVHIVWQDIESGMFNLHYTRSLDRGLTWESVRQLTNKPNYPRDPDTNLPQQPPSIFPYIAARGDKLAIVFQDDRWDREPLRRPDPDNWEIAMLISEDNGRNWGDEIRITKKNGESKHPSCLIDDLGKVHIVWQDKRDSSQNDIYYNTYPLMETDIRVSSMPKQSLYPVIRKTSIGYHIIWFDAAGSDQSWQLFYSSSIDGLTWSAPVQLTRGGKFAGFHTLTDDGQNLYLVWTDDRDNDWSNDKSWNEEIYFMRTLQGK